MISARLKRFRRQEAAEMNITAFMNLMVILVPFLLITAVFSRLAVLELALPAPDTEQREPDPDRPRLILTVRDSGLQLDDERGALQTFPIQPDGYNTVALNDLLQEIKKRRPKQTTITLLMEPDIAYDDMIQIMDAVRAHRAADDALGRMVLKQRLFPDISIGDAPPAMPAAGGNAPDSGEGGA